MTHHYFEIFFQKRRNSCFETHLFDLINFFEVVFVYNRYVEKNVPYRQRSGKIKSKDLNRILPEGKMQVENREQCIQVMRELIRRKEVYESVKSETPVDWDSIGVPIPFDSMSIRRFCNYYRIADTIFWSKSDYERAKKAVNIEDDVEYYTHHGLHHTLEGCDLDSEKEFEHFAKDHYGELGLSRMNGFFLY